MIFPLKYNKKLKMNKKKKSEKQIQNLTFRWNTKRNVGGWGRVLALGLGEPKKATITTRNSSPEGRHLLIFAAKKDIYFLNFSRTPNPRFCWRIDEFLGWKANIHEKNQIIFVFQRECQIFYLLFIFFDNFQFIF